MELCDFTLLFVYLRLLTEVRLWQGQITIMISLATWQGQITTIVALIVSIVPIEIVP